MKKYKLEVILLIIYNILCYFLWELLFNIFFIRYKVKWFYLYDWFIIVIGDCLCFCDFVIVLKYINVSDVRFI